MCKTKIGGEKIRSIRGTRFSNSEVNPANWETSKSIAISAQQQPRCTNDVPFSPFVAPCAVRSTDPVATTSLSVLDILTCFSIVPSRAQTDGVSGGITCEIVERMESVREASEQCNGFGNALWGADGSTERMIIFSDATDGSDFTPAQLERIRNKQPVQTAPLPRGVLDVHWQPPASTGLEHSAPIFETEADSRGRLRLSSEGINASNSHFRSWQEDNGVAKTFASVTEERVVDGERRTVAVGRGPSSVRAAASANMKKAGSPIVRQGTMIIPPSMSAGATNGSPMFAMSKLNGLAELPSTMEDGSDTSQSSEENESRVLEEGIARPSLPSTDGSSQQISPTLRHPSTGAVSDVAEEQGCAQSRGNGRSSAVEEAAAGPLLPPTDGSNEQISSTPRRPSDGLVSSHARQQRPGRSLSTKEVVDDVGATALAKEQEGAEVVRCPSPANPSGGACERTSVTTTLGEDTTTTTTVGTAGMVCDPEIRGEETRMGGEQDGQDDQEGETKGRHEGKEPSTSTPSPKVEEKTQESWWRVSRMSKASFREQPQKPSEEQPRKPSRQPSAGEQPKESAQQSELPPVSSTARSDGAPEPRRWLSFRSRHTPRTVA